MSRFLGITREPIFSPGKVDADRMILEAVAEALRQRGHVVDVVAATTLRQPAPDTVVFTMAQGEAALVALTQWERAGILVINSVAAVLNCHRHRMLERFRAAAVAVPETILLEDAPQTWPDWLRQDGAWLKRGDVHATEADDVVFVRAPAAAAAVLGRFHRRGIARAVLQRHLDGVVVKFYAVGARLIGWFPAPGSALTLSESEVATLRGCAESGARALGLDVYGGDCVVRADRSVWLIDLNDWPSYAPCRSEAAAAIASHIEAHKRIGV